jgi:hypothetical protein
MERELAESIVEKIKAVTAAIGDTFPVLEKIGQVDLAKQFSDSLLRAVDEIYSGIILTISDKYPDLDPYRPKSGLGDNKDKG